MKWTVGAKLSAGFGVIVAVMLVLAVVQGYVMRQLTAEVEELYRTGVVATESLGDAQSILQRIRGRVFYHIASTDEAARREIELAIEGYESDMFAALDAAKAQLPDGDERADRIERIEDLYRDYAELRDRTVYPTSRAGDEPAAIDAMVDQAGPAFSAVADELRSFSTEHVNRNRRTHDEVLAAVADTNLASVAGTILATLLAIAIAWLLSRNISSRLRHLTGVASEVTRGDLERRARVAGGDEITELGAAFNEMTASLAKSLEEQRDTATEQAERQEQLIALVIEYGDFVERVASGDLRATLRTNGTTGDLASLGRNLDAMGGALRTMAVRMDDAVGSLASASAEILATIQQHGASANESATAVAETVATVDEVTQSAQRVAEQAEGVAGASQQSVEVTNAGRAAVSRTIGAMSDVRNQMDQIAGRIMALSEQAQAVSRIISTVNELAEQSNLLALNASIEAARAGEEGRGFAVVAQEIRALADQSREATSEVRSILGDIQRSTGEAVLATEQGTSAVARAVEAAQGAGDRIEELAQTIADSAGAAQRILQSGQQQVQAVGQIAHAMHSISDASRQTVEGTRHVEKAARDLNDLSDQLRDAVAQYRT